MSTEAAESRDEVLARVRERVLAAARRSVSPADAEDIARETMLLLTTKYAHVTAAHELVALGDQALLDALAVLEPRTPLERLRAWYEREATLLDLAGVGVVVAAAIVGSGVLVMRATSRSRSEVVRPMGAALSTQQLAVLLELPEQQVVPAGLEIIDRPDATFSAGDPMHLRLSLRAPARIALVEEPPDGTVVQVWPGLSQAPALIPRPSSGGPAVQAIALDAPAEPGAHRLRLVVAPADLDLGALSPAALREAAARLTLVDLRYEVRR